MKIKPIIGSPFFGVFPSDRFPKATKDVDVLSFIHVVIPVNYTSEFLLFILANFGNILKLVRMSLLIT